MVEKRTQVQNFPNLSGHYEFERNPEDRYSADLTENDAREITGTVSTTRIGSVNVRGAVTADGSVQLVADRAIRFRPFLVERKGDLILLRETDPTNPVTFEMKSRTGPESVAVTLYTYSWSPAFNNQIVEANKDHVALGPIKVLRVRELLLGPTADTMAHAKVDWTVDLNAVGRAVKNGPENGTGIAIFGKQPDGKWIVTDFGLTKGFF